MGRSLRNPIGRASRSVFSAAPEPQTDSIEAPDDAIQGCLPRPEGLQGEAVGSNVVFERLDPILAVGTATIDAPEDLG